MGLLDFFRRKKVAPTKNVGAPGTAIHGGYILEGETNADLTGRQKYITYHDALVNATIIGAGCRLFLNLIAKPDWRAEPAEDGGAQADELAEFVEATFSDMVTPWHRVVRRSAGYKFWGFSVSAWQAKLRDDGKIGYLDIKPRPQSTIERWDTDLETGEVLGMIQRPPQTFNEIYIPRSRTIYAVDDSLSDSPEGLGLFRHIIQSAQDRARYRHLEGVGFETDLRGIPVGRIPYGEIQDRLQNPGDLVDEAAAAALKAPIEKFVQNHVKGPQLGILLDSQTYRNTDDAASPSAIPKFGIELLKGGSTSQPEIAKTLLRLDHEMARVLGVEHLLLGQEKGTQALAKVKASALGQIVESALKELAETFQDDYLDPLFALNGWDPKLKPKLKTAPLQLRDIEELTGALQNLAQAGAPLMPEDEAVNVIRETAGLPPVDFEALAEDAALTPPNIVTEPVPDEDDPAAMDEVEDAKEGE